MKSYDYIVFDVDGTLLDTEYSIIKSLQRLVFQMQGRTIREEYEKGVVSRGLGDYFETVVCCDDTARHKPNPEPMLFYLSQSKASPETGSLRRRQYLRYEMCRGGWRPWSTGSVGMQKQGTDSGRVLPEKTNRIIEMINTHKGEYTMKELEKTYNPADIEERLYQKWLDGKYFHADAERGKREGKKPFTIVMPPPNITGQLHMGHALDNTMQDILIRYKRMQGYEALWQPGTDHAAIATEVKVIDKLKSEGIEVTTIWEEKVS